MGDRRRVSTRQAACELGIAQETVQYYMLTGQLDLGTVAKSRSGKRNRYLIFRDKLDKVLGKGGGL